MTDKMKEMKTSLCLLFLLLSGALASQPAEWSLDDCIRLAWKQNPALRNSVLDVKEAKADYVASIGSFLPRLVASGQAGRNFGRSIDPETNAYTTATFDEGTVGLEMTLSLFEGFSRINRVRFRKITLEHNEWAWKHRENELACQVMEAYLKCLLEKKLVALAVEQCTLSERYVKQAEAFVGLGLKSPSDLQEVRARREGDLYRLHSRENSVDLTLLHLKQLLNMEPGDSLVLQDTIQAEVLPLIAIPDADRLFVRSVEVLPSMRMAELRLRASRKQYAAVGGAFLPSVYLRGSMGSNYYNTLFSAQQLQERVGKYIGVGISFPLLNGLERLTNQRKQKLNIYRLKNDEEQQKQQLYSDVEQTVLSLRSGYTEHRQATAQLAAERLVLKESERKWEEGLIPIFQLMEARNRFISAKAELTRVRLQMELTIRLKKYYRQGCFL